MEISGAVVTMAGDDALDAVYERQPRWHGQCDHHNYNNFRTQRDEPFIPLASAADVGHAGVEEPTLAGVLP